MPGPAADLGLGEAMAAAQRKLLAALPSERRQGASRVASRFHLDPVGWYQGAERAVHLPALAEAVWNEQCVRARYESWKGIVERELEPLGLALKAGIWYLVAQVDGKPRTYRISNIHDLELTDRTFMRPQTFELGAYWRAWLKDFEARLYAGEARLRLSPVGVKRLATFAPAVGEVALRTASVPDEKGWIEVDIPIESVDHAARELVTLGAEGEVLAPRELRERMIETALQMRALYDRRAR